MIVREVRSAWGFFPREGFKTTLLSRDTPFLIQFRKYGVCGVLSVVVFLTANITAYLINRALVFTPGKHRASNSRSSPSSPSSAFPSAKSSRNG